MIYLYGKNERKIHSISEIGVKSGHFTLDDSIPYKLVSQNEIKKIYHENSKPYHYFNYWYDEKADEIAFENIPFTEEEKEQAIKEEEEQANRPPYRPPRRASLSNIMQDTEKIDETTEVVEGETKTIGFKQDGTFDVYLEIMDILFLLQDDLEIIKSQINKE